MTSVFLAGISSLLSVQSLAIRVHKAERPRREADKCVRYVSALFTKEGAQRHTAELTRSGQPAEPSGRCARGRLPSMTRDSCDTAALRNPSTARSDSIRGGILAGTVRESHAPCMLLRPATARLRAPSPRRAYAGNNNQYVPLRS